jgi:hypothetical protein
MKCFPHKIEIVVAIINAKKERKVMYLKTLKK